MFTQILELAQSALGPATTTCTWVNANSSHTWGDRETRVELSNINGVTMLYWVVESSALSESPVPILTIPDGVKDYTSTYIDIPIDNGEVVRVPVTTYHEKEYLVSEPPCTHFSLTDYSVADGRQEEVVRRLLEKILPWLRACLMVMPARGA
jgi:hypothetical protein